MGRVYEGQSRLFSKHCYAETLVTGRMGRAGTWGPSGTRERTSAALWRKPVRWDALALEGKLPDGSVNPDGHRPRVFCASLADVFEPRPELAGWRYDLFDLIAATPALDWLVLTKRPDYAAGWLADYYGNADRTTPASLFALDASRAWSSRDSLGWGALPNLWVGTSIESTAYTWRADWLRLIPAPVRFISAEPLLGSLFAVPQAGGAAAAEGPAPMVGSPDEASAAGSTPVGADGESTPSASQVLRPGAVRRLATASGAEGDGLTEGQPPRGANPGDDHGGNRNRPDAAGGARGLQPRGVSASGSIPDVSIDDNATTSDATRAGTSRVAPPGDPAGRTDRLALDSRQGGPGEPRPRGPLDLTGIDWVIVGGESGGRNARPMHPDWAREIRAAAAGDHWCDCLVPTFEGAGQHSPGCRVFQRPAFHFKQFGSWTPDGAGDLDPHLTPSGRLLTTNDISGFEWPCDSVAVRFAGVAPTAGGKLLDGVAWQEFPAPAPVPA